MNVVNFDYVNTKERQIANTVDWSWSLICLVNMFNNIISGQLSNGHAYHRHIFTQQWHCFKFVITACIQRFYNSASPACSQLGVKKCRVAALPAVTPLSITVHELVMLSSNIKTNSESWNVIIFPMNETHIIKDNKKTQLHWTLPWSNIVLICSQTVAAVVLCIVPRCWDPEFNS